MSKLEIRTTDWIERMETYSKKQWTSNESLKEYIRDLETSNEMYKKDSQEIFDDLIDELEKQQ